MALYPGRKKPIRHIKRTGFPCFFNEKYSNILINSKFLLDEAMQVFYIIKLRKNFF